MSLRSYDLDDLMLCKLSPMRWSVEDYAEMGRAEFALRTGRFVGGDVRLKIHIFVQRARTAHEREGTISPWNDDYERVSGLDGLPIPPENHVAFVPKPYNLMGHILDLLHHQGRTTIGDIQEAMGKRSYSDGSVSKTVSQMKTSGKLESPDTGIYQITPLGREVLAEQLREAERAATESNKRKEQGVPA